MVNQPSLIPRVQRVSGTFGEGSALIREGGRILRKGVR